MSRWARTIQFSRRLALHDLTYVKNATTPTPRILLINLLKNSLQYSPLVGFVGSLVAGPFFLPLLTCLVIFAISSYFLFKDTLNKLQAVGPFYWITRDLVPPNTPLLSKGFMHETDFPWRHGKGIQIRIPHRTFQIGLCKKHKQLDDQEGVLAAVQGRFMDIPPTEIGEW